MVSGAWAFRRLGPSSTPVQCLRAETAALDIDQRGFVQASEWIDGLVRELHTRPMTSVNGQSRLTRAIAALAAVSFALPKDMPLIKESK